MQRIRVSIIEDNVSVRNNLMKFIALQKDLFVGDVFGSAVSFLSSTVSHYEDQVHILLLDIGLPGMSGIEAIPLLLHKLPDINIVILTTYEEEDMILKALCSGACSYISKRTPMENIMDALRIVAAGGSYMSPSIAREIVNHLMGGRVSKATILTDRQKEILQKLADGKSYEAIGAELFVSVETVRTHVKKMYKVLHVNNKIEAITKYMRGHIK